MKIILPPVVNKRWLHDPTDDEVRTAILSLPPHFSGFTVGNSVKASGANNKTVTSGTVDMTGNNLIVVACSSYGVNAEPTLTDNQSNTWTKLTTIVDTTGTRQTIFYAFAPTVSISQTFTWQIDGTTICYPAIVACGFNGSASSPLDGQNGAFNHTSATQAPGSITPANNNALVISSCSFSVVSTMTVGGGFTIIQQQQFNSGTNYGCAMAYLIQTTAAAANPTWTQASSASIAAKIAAFDPSVSSPRPNWPVMGNVWNFTPDGEGWQ